MMNITHKNSSSEFNVAQSSQHMPNIINLHGSSNSMSLSNSNQDEILIQEPHSLGPRESAGILPAQKSRPHSVIVNWLQRTFIVECSKYGQDGKEIM
mmetsp:Transcript_7461/g.15205  ORF Transcript_7461/g.15205 Transcript_7461/m.15205 type:complete len:97 (+) Transcript_7461:188-478(+)